MKQGRFEIGRGAQTPADGEKQKPARKKRLDWLLFAVPLVVLAALAAILLIGAKRDEYEESQKPGMTREETVGLYNWLANVLENHDMVLTIRPENPEEGEEPVQLTISPRDSRPQVDLAGLEADLEQGVGKVSRTHFELDPKRYVSLDKTRLRELAEDAAATYGQQFLPSFAALQTVETGNEEKHTLLVNIGSTGRDISAERIYDTLMESYLKGEMTPSISYTIERPKPLDARTISEQCTTPPVDAVLNDKTFEITPEIPGYGVEEQEVEQVLAEAEEGKGYQIPLRELQPAVTAADVEASLYSHTLSEAHTPHSWNDDRTTNLKLACAAIDGTVVMPGEIFSFNETVGQRTPEKGYREATIYASGGTSKPETGGGVCQVASSIYYAVLQADLETVERHTHMFLVTYVPHGMDAAIYWGSLDYKFRNISPYPIKIEASVSDGMVHIYLCGKEWKDYRVTLDYEILEEFPYETKYQYVYDGSYYAGETIVTPYTGYRIATYRTVIDKEGNALETTKIATSRYNKRDKVVAAIPPATQPSTTTEPPSDDDDD